MDRLLELGCDRIVVQLLGLVLGLSAQLRAMHPDERHLRALPCDVVRHQRALGGDRGQLLDPGPYSRAACSSTCRQGSGESNKAEDSERSRRHLHVLLPSTVNDAAHASKRFGVSRGGYLGLEEGRRGYVQESL